MLSSLPDSQEETSCKLPGSGKVLRIWLFPSNIRAFQLSSEVKFAQTESLQ
jgi:hypothetical protein